MAVGHVKLSKLPARGIPSKLESALQLKPALWRRPIWQLNMPLLEYHKGIHLASRIIRAIESSERVESSVS